MVSYFPTELGWFALAGREKRVIALTFGYPTEEAVRQDVRRRFAEETWSEGDWNPEARMLCARYAAGEPCDLSKIAVELFARTEFQRTVLLAVLALDYGETASYGEIAERVGAPGAARAVGTVMSTNRIPLLIPCHRVTAAGGRLGGYTTWDGVTMKQRLLDMERQNCLQSSADR